jgi:hypothetical protein
MVVNSSWSESHPVIGWLTQSDPEHGRIIVNTSEGFGVSVHLSTGQRSDFLPA